MHSDKTWDPGQPSSCGSCGLLCWRRLQQLQGKPVAVPPGARSAMADTSKVLGLIEGLTATAPSADTLNANPPAVGAAAGRAVSAASAAGATRGTAAGGKGAPAVPAMSKAEQVGASLWLCLSSQVGLAHLAACVWAVFPKYGLDQLPEVQPALTCCAGHCSAATA